MNTPQSSKWPTTQCRSCKGEIIWTFDQKGRRLPVDAEPDHEGKLILSLGTDGRVHSRVLLPAHLRWGRKLFRSHFTRCPDAAKWNYHLVRGVR